MTFIAMHVCRARSLVCLLMCVLSIHTYSKAIVIVNDTKSGKYVELYTTVDDHLWMRKNNTFQGAPSKKIPLFRAQMVSKNILKTRPFLLNNLTAQASWGKKNQNQYEQHFNLAESNALEGDPVPHKFSDHHIIRLFDAPAGSIHPIQAELLYFPHGTRRLKKILSERRNVEKNTLQ